MLAQIVHLDTALEEKKKDINRQALKRQEIAGKIDETKTEYVTQRREKKKPRQNAQGVREKSTLATVSKNTRRCYLPTSRKKIIAVSSQIDNCGIASGVKVVTKNTLPQKCLKTTGGCANASERKRNETKKQFQIETDGMHYLAKNSNDDANLSLSDCDAEKTLEKKRTKHKRRGSSSAKRERKERLQHDSNYEEEALRRKLSLISIDSSNCETQINLMKKENPHYSVGDNVCDSKIEAAMKKSNRSSIGKSESSIANNSVKVDVNENEIENAEFKYDPSKAYASQQGRAFIKLSSDSAFVEDDRAFTTVADQVFATRQAVKITNQASNGNSDLGVPLKHSVKMETKINRSNDDDVRSDIPSRVIVIKNPRIKSRKNHKSKSVGKQSEKEKSQVKSDARSEKKKPLSKNKKKESDEGSGKIKENFSKNAEIERFSQHLSTIDAKDQLKSLKDKRKKKIKLSDDDLVNINDKQKHQPGKSDYEIKPFLKSKHQTFRDSSEQKLDQEKRKRSQEMNVKYVSKKTIENDLWFSYKTHPKTDKTNRPTSSNPSKKKDNKVKIAQDQKVSSKVYKSHRTYRQSLTTCDMPNKEAQVVDTNWHVGPTNYDTLIPVRSEQRGRKANAPEDDAFGVSPSKYLTKTVSSSDTDSNSQISYSSHNDALSLGSQASLDHFELLEKSNGRHRQPDKYKSSKSSSSSNETSNKLHSAALKTALNKNHRYPQRSASSTSSFQRYSLYVVDAKLKPKHKHTNNDPTSKRYTNKGTNAEDIVRDSPPSTPNENMFEPRFGKRRTKRPNVCVVAEGEDGHSPWQHQHLVVISQKPGAFTARKLGVHKAHQQSKQLTGNLEKTLSDDSYKRPQTIRDLYSLHNVLSDTQNGTVISGYRRNDGVRVAIKRISKAATSRWGKINTKTVPLELALLCQVNEARCSGVVQVVEWHETNEAYLLVMIRPHPVVDLYDYVTKHKRVKESLARHIIRQLVGALRDCIASGVLHRDVKLENILLNPETTDITLIDFGCGDYVRTTSYKEFAGTPEYYPPEWFSRKQYNAEPMTVWSIGVLLYSLLCGTLPFRSSAEIREKDANKFPSDVSRSARDLIGLLLQKNPRERLGMRELFEHPWLAKSSKLSL